MTDRRGRFSARACRPARAAPTGSCSKAPAARSRSARGVSIRVPASSTIRASRTRLSGAARIRFSGRLRNRGQRIPGRGVVLILQGFDNGRWRTFADTRTNRLGRWRVSYPSAARPGSYPVRVRIRKLSGFPFELGYSRRLTIRVG